MLVWASLALAWGAGCADWSYERIRLGMPQRDCARLFTEDTVWQTDLGLCYQETIQAGRTDAIVVLLGQDQRVAAKFQATRVEPAWWRVGQAGGFRLRGELEPKSTALNATGPMDTLRAVGADLLSYRGARPAREVHAWIAAGLVRLMERWPHLGDALPQDDALTDVLDRVPAGGDARIGVDRRGVYLFEYRHGTVP